jgi:ribosomal protein L37AE/L43A
MELKQILKKENFVKSTKKEIEKDYKYSYKCKKCHTYYGNDKKEIGINLCPICEYL